MIKEKTIGLIIPQETYLFSSWAYNYYFTELLRGIIAPASLFEWDILMLHRNIEDNQNYIDLCHCEKVNGLIILSPILKEEEVSRIRALDKPVVIVNGRYPGISYVDADNYNGAATATKYLIDMGHKRIAVINGKMSTHNARVRFSSYKNTLSKNGLKIDNKLVRYGDYSEDSGHFEMKSIIKLKLSQKKLLPTAVFCMNDLMAIGAMKAIKEENLKIPEDISVIGFDDLIISDYLSPPLTTVRQPLFHLGKEALILLIGIIKGNKEKYQKIEIKTRLIKRKSVLSLK